MERYLRVNLLGPGPRLMKKEFTGPRSHKFWERLLYSSVLVTRDLEGRMGWEFAWRGYLTGATNVCAKAFITSVGMSVPAPNDLTADVFGTGIVH